MQIKTAIMQTNMQIKGNYAKRLAKNAKKKGQLCKKKLNYAKKSAIRLFENMQIKRAKYDICI